MTTTPPPQLDASALRKAAILVSSLDRDNADKLLDQMPETQAAQVRQAVFSLDEITPEEQQEVIAEFVGRDAQPELENEDVTLELSEAAQAPDASVNHGEAQGANVNEVHDAPFGFLRTASSEVLARYLQKESFQVAAVVMSHLPPERSAEILNRLPGSAQVEVIRRIVELDEMRPEILQEIERQIRDQLHEQLQAPLRRNAGLATAGAILRAASRHQRSDVLTHLAQTDLTLAGQLRGRPSSGKPLPPQESNSSPPPKTQQSSWLQKKSAEAKSPMADEQPHKPQLEVEPSHSQIEPWPFRDLEKLANRDLLTILKSAVPKVAMLAMTGADPKLVDRLLKQVPAEQAQAFRKQLEQQGPLRLRDVELAQQQLGQLAAELAASGKIEGGQSRRFAVAA